MVLPPDSSALQLPVPTGGKWKFTGPVNVTVQQGTGNVATPTATGKVKADAAATAPGAAAASTKPAGLPWWVFGLVATAGAALVVWLQHQFTFFSFLKR
ncbi:hypothetical protein JAO73_10445 [Hymenobacter sp. BT523]|uniref:hypothetical protein n=1 Tax=Hymenobacter sp. BT523 TaxID=2795725 RepID=UPI0018EB6D68|nr:hypothetical protein [Hymenobacter sp. BT523]MBJ6109434.1 hypothetical protein [Hymenobacter sp. BT523]